jgi:hypothetical protein
MSQDTTASTHEQMEEQLEQLEQPDAISEAELKQALKESKREAHGWQKKGMCNISRL